MIITPEIKDKIEKTFERKQADVLIEAIDTAYNQLVKVSDFNELKAIVKELAEAQKRTEYRLEELVEAQKELAKAQKGTEMEMVFFSKTMKNMQKEFGGISNTIGYGLEDSFYSILPQILEEDFKLVIEGTLERTYIEYPDGKYDEVNILGKGRRNGGKVVIIGESKAQIGKADVRNFARKLRRLKDHFNEKIIPIFLCYVVHPEVEKFLKDYSPDVKLYKSYEIKRRAGKG